MSLRNVVPYRFQPAGLSDAVAEDFGFPGACSLLTNLIPDPGNTNIWQARPAAVQLAALPAGFAANAFISAMIVVGNRLYGMAAGSGAVAGKDIPFCYDLITNSFVTITGMVAGNSPTSVASSYSEWVPPQMEVVGTFVLITHPGYDGITNFFGWINISNPAALVYAAGNTTINPLPSKPVAVAQFGQRAYYMINPTTGNPGVYATDVLLPLQITNATFVVNFGDNIPLSGFGYVSLQSPLTGGVTQALLVFKDDSNIFQVTGDFSSTNVASNNMNAATGTLAINAIINTPKGVLFMSPDGIRAINQQGTISDPIGAMGKGIVNPFIFAGTQTRAAAASTASVFRISLQNGNVAGSPIQEFWYDLVQQRWSGPHSFPASLICPWRNTFIMTPIGINGSIWRSDVQQSGNSTYIENGSQLTYTLQTALFADAQQMARINVNEATVKIALAAGAPSPMASLLDQNGATLNTATLPPGGTAFFWGTKLWGTHIWLGAPNNLVQRPLQWSSPVVFNEAALRITGQCGAGFKIGDIWAKAEILGYLQGTP